MQQSSLFIIIFSFCFFSCIKDKPQEPLNTAITVSADNNVLVINEGGYGWNNASISLYDPNSNSVITDYYKQQNGNATLGDVCQSITKYNNKYYIVVNNSNKIIVANAYNLAKIATITGFNSPRNLLPITYSKAYVSDLYANSIQIINLNSNAISGSIACPSGTEEMALIYNKVFVTNYKTGYCYVVNTVTDIIIDSIFVGEGASTITIDKNSNLWILANGNSSQNIVGKLVSINSISNQILSSFNFSGNDSPTKLCINKTRDTLYYLNKGVYQFPIFNSQLPTNALINQGSKLYYGLGINYKDYTIYVSDAIDYVQKSKIEIYTASGTFKASFNADIISNGFIFSGN